ncbi:MAG: type IIA DNA topoisomerase subunit B, partial [Deltaproteobacteria bacterium]|nr:type IIA DNA topoisomerase subunit B [Deltaproteobacteria bacterium]
IKTLDPLSHIRLRTGMYIGRLGDGTHPADGIYVLMKEVVDNSVDEFIMGEGRKIDITRTDATVAVRDYGRGIPLGKVIECVSQINTGGKYNDDVFQFSVGLNGVGTKAVNALSEQFEVISYRDNQFVRGTFERGKLKKEDKGRNKEEPNGTFVRFTPDPEIFKKYTWHDEFIARRLHYYVFLNAGLTINYNGQSFSSKNGLRDLLEFEIGQEPVVYEVCHHKEAQLEFAFTHTNNYGETYYSFVNGQFTNDGGTHQSAFREGLLKAVNEFAGKSFSGEDVREGIVGAVAIKLKDPVFESQTKHKLGSADVRSWMVPAVKEATERWLHSNPESANKLLEKIRTNEKIRTELAKIKKEARERARSVALRIPKLRDCKIHFGEDDLRREETSLFITEGDSAGGSLVQCRDVETQAIFTIKGKPLNCFGLARDAIYKNEELYNIMCALGVENGLDTLRYNRVIIATDADVDGMHIRNLLLTYFLRFFEDLVTRGHVYILETPLFRVRNKQETRYCYSESERDAAMAMIKNNEVTRFKGLGEISPKEFGQFIGGDMRLVQVNIENMAEVTKALQFYMGKNTPERKDFIVNNLIYELEAL